MVPYGMCGEGEGGEGLRGQLPLRISQVYRQGSTPSGCVGLQLLHLLHEEKLAFYCAFQELQSPLRCAPIQASRSPLPLPSDQQLPEQGPTI